jgi:dsDNA-specific endonuclease/ATPase MutS2
MLNSLAQEVSVPEDKLPLPPTGVRRRVMRRIDAYEEERIKPLWRKLVGTLAEYGRAYPKLALAQLAVIITLAAGLSFSVTSEPSSQKKDEVSHLNQKVIEAEQNSKRLAEEKRQAENRAKEERQKLEGQIDSLKRKSRREPEYRLSSASSKSASSKNEAISVIFQSEPEITFEMGMNLVIEISKDKDFEGKIWMKPVPSEKVCVIEVIEATGPNAEKKMIERVSSKLKASDIVKNVYALR